MSAVRVERSHVVDDELFRVGRELCDADLDLFESFVMQGAFRHAGSIPEWRRFFDGETTHLTFEGTTVEDLVKLFNVVADECCNREHTGFGRTKKVGSDRWSVANFDPDKLPVVLTDLHVCYGCGKRHADPIGWNLDAWPFEVPCCPGRGEFDLKRSCRLEAMERLSSCPSCGRRSFETRGGRVCRDCHRLVEEGRKARKGASATSVVLPSSAGMSYDLGKAFGGVLEALGARKVRTKVEGESFPKDGFVIPELAAPEVRAFVEACGAEISAAHRKGLDTGRNLLLGLAEGTVSVADFNAGRS